ncbi:antibiotic acetyltransferase, partial [Bacillus anthracis]|nr:antibiotic acetyltransferase [Bacillus anthracis]
HITGHTSSKGEIVVGNDVWTGYQSCILSGVTIGNGAIIGAWSVITKDVPSYAIVTGNPAKFVRYRFLQETIEKLKNFAWLQ